MGKTCLICNGTGAVFRHGEIPVEAYNGSMYARPAQVPVLCSRCRATGRVEMPRSDALAKLRELEDTQRRLAAELRRVAEQVAKIKSEVTDE